MFLWDGKAVVKSAFLPLPSFVGEGNNDVRREQGRKGHASTWINDTASVRGTQWVRREKVPKKIAWTSKKMSFDQFSISCSVMNWQAQQNELKILSTFSKSYIKLLLR